MTSKRALLRSATVKVFVADIMEANMMLRSAFCISVALTLTPAIGSAQDFDAGLAAAEAGDFVTALREWMPLAEQGDASAQTNLGFMYASGQGVPQDYAEAVRWYKKAAEQGNAAAQRRLGLSYKEGNGVPQDYAEAVIWFRKAGEQGEALAQTNLGFMYQYGQGVPQDYAEAVRWYRKAAEQGGAGAFAQAGLGFMYDQGQGVPQDFVSAHMWYNLASGNSFADAPAARDALAAKMTPEDVSEAQRRARVCLESNYQDCG